MQPIFSDIFLTTEYRLYYVDAANFPIYKKLRSTLKSYLVLFNSECICLNQNFSVMYQNCIVLIVLGNMEIAIAIFVNEGSSMYWHPCGSKCRDYENRRFNARINFRSMLC